MPTYEYECEACGNRFEKFQSITAAPLRKCPKCGKNKVKRLFGTGAGIIFKGSGFYSTDYRDKSYAEKSKAESSAAEAKTETKPAETKAADAAKPATSESKPAAKHEPKARSDSKKSKR